MIYSTSIVLSLLATSAIASVTTTPHLIASDVNLARRAARAAASNGSETSSSYLANILGLSTGACSGPCGVATQSYTQCANQSSAANVANCACSAASLGNLRTCASCVAQGGNSTIQSAVVGDYNSFVDLCVSDGLASVTGTVSVGQRTSAISSPAPTSTTAVSGATTKATYTIANGTTSVAAVPTLVGGSATATGSASGSAGTSATTPSGAGRTLVGSSLAGVVIVALSLLA